MGVRRVRTFPFLPTPLTTPSLTFRLWSSENQIVGVGNRSGRINQSQCTSPRFVIGLVLLLLLPTPTVWFSLDHKRNISDGVVSGIGTLFLLDYKVYASDYGSDSDSVASENQPQVKDSRKYERRTKKKEKGEGVGAALLLPSSPIFVFALSQFWGLDYLGALNSLRV